MKLVLTLTTLALASAVPAPVKKREAVQPPDYFPKACPRNTRDASALNECVRKNFQAVLPLISRGEELFNMQSLEPVFMTDYRLNFDYFAFNYKALFDNMTVHGLSKGIIRDVRCKALTDDKVDLEFDAFFPKLFAQGRYWLDGRFANFPFSGRGPFSVSVNGFNGTFRLKGDTVVRDGERYVQVKRLAPTFTTNGIKLASTNDVKKYEEFTNMANTVFNQFWRPIAKAVIPSTYAPLERNTKHFAVSVFDSVPFRLLFPVE